MATIDVISADKGFHKNIAFDHIKRNNWPTYSDMDGRVPDETGETMRAPFVVVGGHLQINPEEKVNFFDSSGDYGSDIFFSDSNSIAAYVASACGLDVEQADKAKGELFVADLLTFMKENKLKEDFYEKFVEFVFEKNDDGGQKFTGQHMGSLITMKAADRAIKEEKSIIETTVDEVSGGGLSRFLMLSTLASKLRAKEKNKE